MLPVPVPGCLPQKWLAHLSAAEVASLPGSLRRIHSAWLGPSVQMLKCKVKHSGIFQKVWTTQAHSELQKKWCLRRSELLGWQCSRSHLWAQSPCACQSSKCSGLTWLSLCLADRMWDLPEPCLLSQPRAASLPNTDQSVQHGKYSGSCSISDFEKKDLYPGVYII